VESAPQEMIGSGIPREVMASFGILEGRGMMSMLGLKLLPAQVITWISFLKMLKSEPAMSESRV